MSDPTLQATQAVTEVERQLAQPDVATDNKRTFGQWFRHLGWRHVVGVVAALYAAFPILYIISASLSSGGTLLGSNKLFASVSACNYLALGGAHPGDCPVPHSTGSFWLWFANTLIIASVTAIATVLLASAAAYAFSRFRFAGRRAGLTFLLVIQIFPQMLAFIAIYLLLLRLGEAVPVLGLDSRLALILIYLGGALGSNAFLMYGFFNSIPKELDESAKVDGATHAQTYWLIIMPLVTPIIAVVALLSFITTVGEFIIARLVLPSETHQTAAVGLYGWVSDELSASWGQFAAGAVVTAAPVLLLFLFLQRYIVSGLTAGAVKG
ncbi:MAG: sugar ABC transporter permease [Propionibacteriaceae bacterium]|jgi:arabinogalactan oligomer/maltooligosaccharide transport system permease protein|nr:sugar ABC transporter permease [Propionibacteriaceae bacterium]